MGTRLFIYRYSRVRGVGRWAWLVVMALCCDSFPGCGGEDGDTERELVYR